MFTRGNKYRAKRTTVDGVKFASTAEAARYAQLRLLERAGEIRDLKTQPPYRLYCATAHGELRPIMIGKRQSTYVADFSYYRDVQLVVEDVKGFDLPLAKLKRAIFELNYGVKIDVIRGRK